MGLIKSLGYVAVQAYVNRLELSQLSGLRELIAADAGRPTTFGWGPRFLHSTGQLHKGGADRQLVLQVLAEHTSDVPVPGESYTFGQLERAQADGDLAALRSAGQRAVRVPLSELLGAAG